MIGCVPENKLKSSNEELCLNIYSVYSFHRYYNQQLLALAKFSISMLLALVLINMSKNKPGSPTSVKIMAREGINMFVLVCGKNSPSASEMVQYNRTLLLA